jgi:membrane-bound lytic murein transglycosylase D
MRRLFALTRRLVLATAVLALGGFARVPRAAAELPHEPPPAPSPAPVAKPAPAKAPAKATAKAPPPAPPAEPAADESAQAPRIEMSSAEVDALVQQLLEQARADAAAEQQAGREPNMEVEVAPPIMTSDAPQPSAELPAAPDIAWLRNIELPDIPVRWHEQVVQLLNYYKNDPRGRAHIRAWVQRSGRYDEMIRKKLAALGVPQDLLFVAMVESAFDPTTVSSADAVGMWQFVEVTGVDYGLEVTKWTDLRRDPELATEAAGRYLKDLYAKLGSWPLALAAFNMGYGALVRSLRKYNTNDFWLLSRLEAGLPYETTVYVAKIMACAVVAHNPERFGLGDLKKDAKEDTARVEVPGGVGLGRLASAAGMTADALAALNPELLKKRIPPDVKSWKLRIPADRVERFSKRWPQLASETVAHAAHVLRFGERIKDVAQMYGTTEPKLRALNSLEDAAEVLPGTRLLVPDVKPEALPVPDDLVVGVPERVFSYPDRKQVFYRVQTGDTPQRVADAFGVTLDELRQWNSVAIDAALPSGMTLQVFVRKTRDLSKVVYVPAERVRTLIVGSDAFFEFHEAERDRVRVRYRARNGDTLGSLAERFELSVGSIARINGFSREHLLATDEEIILYVPTKDAQKLSGAQAARP